REGVMNPDWDARRQERWARRQERWERRRQWNPHADANPMRGIIFGLLLMGGGLLFLLRNLGIVYFDNLWDYWPVILIVIGGAKLTSARCTSDIAGGLIIGGIGVVFLLRSLGIIYGNVWGFLWPAFFIAIGVSMLFKNMYGPDWWHGGDGPVVGDQGAPATGFSGESGASMLRVDCVFSGAKRKITSQTFEGGRISVVFGGADIDLRGAAMQKPEIVLHTDAVFGGIDLKVPDTWQVEMRGSGVFGGFEDKTHAPAQPAAGPAPKLIVKGGAVFGGVTVRN
ncbi:MAG: DUF5668 domain-containing protein, partial [Acidobacteriota bacterium]